MLDHQYTIVVVVNCNNKREKFDLTYLVRVEGVDDQAHQLRYLSLEREGLGLARHD